MKKRKEKGKVSTCVETDTVYEKKRIYFNRDHWHYGQQK